MITKRHANDAGQIACPGCSGTDFRPTAFGARVMACNSCGGVFGTIYRGDASRIVDLSGPMQANADPASLRYFDLELLGGDLAVTLTHGWFDAQTKRVVQYG